MHAAVYCSALLAPPTGSCLHREVKLLTFLLMTAGEVCTHPNREPELSETQQGGRRDLGRGDRLLMSQLGRGVKRWAIWSRADVEFSLCDNSWEIHSRMEIIWAETTLGREVRVWNEVLANWEEKQVCHTCSLQNVCFFLLVMSI